MSKRIEQILEVIDEVRDKYQSTSGYKSVKHLRISAEASVASRRIIASKTVASKYITQLKPEIQGAKNFDELLERWLVDDSEELKNILLKHKSNYRDIELINNAFYKPPLSDIPLAQEFGVDPNDEEFKEGKEQLRLHLVKERNRYLVIKAKEAWWKLYDGQARCSVCDFSFRETYGNIGDGFIEAHHTKPISTLEPDTIVTRSELVPVCSNCHSMLHRHRPWLSVEQLKKIVSAKHD
jgi:predicted HNH restriction endonuclease